VLAVDWELLTLPAAFGVGVLFGAIVTLRLAKVLGQFYGEMTRRDRDKT
jgi:hypothetical protein